MGRTGWMAVLACGIWVLASQPVAGQSGERATVRVRLHDEAGVPRNALARAQREAAALFRRSGIGFEWIEADACERGCLVMKIVAKPVGKKSRNSAVVGLATGTREARGTIAFAFYDRISVLSANLDLDAASMLGHVMAHELGHLLLPYDAHSVVGVMRHTWDRAQANGVRNGTLTFAPDQAESIRKRLRASASPIPHAR